MISFLLALLVCGCSRPTYPAAQLTTAVRKICQNEYKLKVNARLIEKTLGISLDIEGLVTEQLGLTSSAAEKIENAALALQRVTLSTDCPVQFYVLCARDTQLIGAEYLLIGNVSDLKRISVQDISRSEYLQRLQRVFHIDPVTLGQNTVSKLFIDLNNNIPPETALKTCARFPLTLGTTEEIFYPGSIAAQPGSLHYQIMETRGKKLSQTEALFRVKTKETYEASPSAQTETTIFPSGFENEYLILIDTINYKQPIIDIVAKFFRQENKIMQRDIRQIFAGYPDSAQFAQDGLPIKGINLNEFLAAQIARRLKETWKRENLPVSSISARFEKNLFRLRLDIEGNEKQICEEALNMAGNIAHSYQLEDFKGAEVTFQNSGEKIRLSKQTLDRLRKNKRAGKPLL
ncbi:MAG: hypothetical protein V1662_02105 [Candidatus Omnitrophota bacterium]